MEKYNAISNLLIFNTYASDGQLFKSVQKVQHLLKNSIDAQRVTCKPILHTFAQ